MLANADILNTLQLARQLLCRPNKWSRLTTNLNHRNVPCLTDDKHITKYSVTGALEWALDDANNLHALCQYVCKCNGVGRNLHDWHRGIESSDGAVVLADVLRILDKAIRWTNMI